MTPRTALLGLATVSTALVWVAAEELRWPARALTCFLLVPLPALLLLQLRQLPDLSTLPRLPIYASSAIAQWVLAALTAALAWASGISRYSLGLAPPADWGTQLLWALAITVAALAINLAGHRLGARESVVLAHLLPRTRAEKAGFLGLSITAGLCEELVFRGFLVTALYTAAGSLSIALLVSAVAFGVVHAYQEPRGVARAAVLGLLLSIPFVTTGSLAASIMAHTAIDIIGGLWLGPRLLRHHR